VSRIPALLLTLAACTGSPSADPPASGPTDPTVSPTRPSGTGTGTSAEAPTYWRDVQPILAEQCVACHRAGDVAPFALEAFEDVLAWAEPIRAAVEAGSMPPWPPSDDCMPLLDARRLTEAQIATIGAWVDQGRAEGDPADGIEVAEPPPFDGDLVLPMTEAYTPNARGDDYRCFVLDWPHDAPAYVTGYEVVPGRRDLVHHVILSTATGFARTQAENLDAGEAGPGYTCYGSSGVLGAQTLGGWVPGVRGVDLPVGTGVLVEPGTALIVQVHYNTVAVDEPEADLTSVGVRIADAVDEPAAAMLVLDPTWLFPGQMSIPAGDPSVVHETTFTGRGLAQSAGAIGLDPDEPFRLHRVALHMHTLGKRSVLQIERAGGGPGECVVEIGDWDFAWQGGYTLAEPLVVAPDDQLRLGCEWDNSGPDAVDVDWGEGTGDEMCLAGLYVTR
jgi:hypothetical protein